MRLTTEQQIEVERLMPKAAMLARMYPAEDAQSVAYLALCKAVLTFDPARGATLETFAGVVIRNHLLNQMRTTARRKSKVTPRADMQEFEE